jgi:hypothetical protein
MWITRNKMCIQRSFPGKPTDIIYLGPSFYTEMENSDEDGGKI